MARIFLDTNCFIDAIHRKPEKEILAALENDSVYVSPLSIHIYCYIFKIRLPHEIVAEQTKKFQIFELSEEIIAKALEGPTTDFEDNVQLHSAAEANCDSFLTSDKDIQKMLFFGKVKIVSGL